MTTPQQLQNLSWMDKYGKSVIAFLYAVATVVIPFVSGDHHVDFNEGIIIALAICNNLVVYIVPLNPEFKSVKSVVNAILAALAVVQVAIATDGHLDLDDWLLIASAILVSIGVKLAPAASLEGPSPVAVGWGADKEPGVQP